MEPYLLHTYPAGPDRRARPAYDLLPELVLHKNSLPERRATLLKLWGDDHFFQARTMDVYIARLRKYLCHDPSVSIVNIRGYGIKLIEA